jgi:hypothetical protein
MACVNAADLMGRQSLQARDSLLRYVVAGPHPFPIPRQIARFYLDEIRESEFIQYWESLLPGDRTYLFYLARKAAMNKGQVVAGLYLNELKRKLPRQRWDYFRIIKILNNLDNW